MPTLNARSDISLNFGSAIKFGSDKVYLFPRASRSMWEMDLEEMTFTLVPDSVLPPFEGRPTIVTDGSLVTRIESSAGFNDKKEIFQFDPVAMTTKFLSVDNWPGFRTYAFFPVVYVPKMRRIYWFGGISVYTLGQDVQSHDIFYVDLIPESQMKANLTGINELYAFCGSKLLPKSVTCQKNWTPTKAQDSKDVKLFLD